MTYFKKNKDIFLLNYLLIVIYFGVFAYLKVEITDKLMFSTIDSMTYWLTGQEFYKFSEIGYSEYRPFLYPLIIVIIHKTFGLYGIWIMQLLFWIISINLVYHSIKQITNNIILSFAGSLIIAFNISYIVLTANALTEAISILLSSEFLEALPRGVRLSNTCVGEKCGRIFSRSFSVIPRGSASGIGKTNIFLLLKTIH